MEKNLFREVYKQVCGLALKDCPSSSLSGLLHGYLSVYSMVRVYPWLEDDYGSLWDIHDRIREIARVIQELLKDKDIPVDTRAGYVVDLMDAYLLYSDVKFLDTALDAAYEILIPKGSDKIVLPCRTPNICRLLCNCYYFTGEDECALLTGGLVTEIMGLSRKFSWDELFAWNKAFQVYKNIIEDVGIFVEEREYWHEEIFRLELRVKQIRNENVVYFLRGKIEGDISSLIDTFDYWAEREFCEYNNMYLLK